MQILPKMRKLTQTTYLAVLALLVAYVFSVPAFAAGLTAKEKIFLGNWFCKNGANKDFYTFLPNGNYQKETELYGREVLEKGAFEVRGNTLYLARLIYVADGEESKTNIVFVREIDTLTDKKIVLTHQGGLGNVVETVCNRKKSWFWW